MTGRNKFALLRNRLKARRDSKRAEHLAAILDAALALHKHGLITDQELRTFHVKHGGDRD